MLKCRLVTEIKSETTEEHHFKCKTANMSRTNSNLALKRVTGTHFSSQSLLFKIFWLLLIFSSCFLTGANGAEEDCPWYGNARVPVIIKSNCQCARNQTFHNQLSVQCNEIDGQQLVSILISARAGLKDPIEFLYLNGSQVTDSNGQIPARLFREIKLASLRLSGCNVSSIHPEAFRGQENYLKHLSLAQNQLSEVPSASLELLTNLALLDLSYNKITKIPKGAFETLTKLSTLKLHDNKLDLDSHCFKGLENSLRTLNLKGTGISTMPEAISNLSSLAFLDLAQNRFRDLEPLSFLRLHSLTVLNLERNLLKSLPESVFVGVNDTLSSLSLLNNLITHFPKEALHSLKELRVLDLGFNLLTEVPTDAFSGLSSLSLLALDGNPLTTLPLTSFIPLNSTLRGLSLGGRFLSCDCRIKWVQDWIHEYDLQVTSRERNPQFCGSPPGLRPLNFYNIPPQDFVCENNEPSSTTPEPTVESAEEAPPNPKSVVVRPHNNNIGRIRQNIRIQKPRIKPIQPQPIRNEEEQKPPPSEQDTAPLTPATSYENDNDDEYESGSESQEHEIHDTASSNSEPVEKLAQSTPSTTPTPTTVSPKPAPSTTQPRRKILNPAVIKAFPGIRPKLQQKVVMSTTSSTSVSSTSTTSTTRDPQDDDVLVSNQNYESFSEAPIPTTTVRPQNNIQAQRFVPSETIQIRKPSVGFDGPDFDDSKIPVITGVGPIRTISGTGSMNPNNDKVGSVISLKSTTLPSIQTQPHPAIPTPQTSPSLGINNRPPNLIFAEKSDILLKDVDRNGDSVHLHWDSQKQVPGFRIIYRIFGEDTFRHGPRLDPSEREYHFKGVPVDQCIVVCVVPYEEILYNEISTSAGSVPPGSQCKELRPNTPSALMTNMDKITIGASAAICITVIVAVFIFILLTKRSKSRRPSSGLISKIPPGSMLSPSPGPPALIPGSLGLIKEWDQMSAISARSIPRARVYHGNPMMEGNNMSSSHGHSHGHGTSRSVVLPVQQQRSVPDGHSTHRSYLSAHHSHHNQSHHSMHSYHNTGHSTTSAAVNNYLNNQSRLLRASLGSRSSQDALNKQLGPSTHVHRHFEQNQKRRRPGVAGRLSQSDSLNTLSGYETPDNWTDHDMDVYVARNATRHDLVQL